MKKLSTIKVHLRQVLAMMKKSNASSSEEVETNSIDEKEVLKNFPMKTLEDYDSFEQKLIQEMFKTKAVLF